MVWIPLSPKTNPGELINNSEYRKRNPAAMTTSKHNESDLYLWKSRSSLIFNYQSQCVPRVKEETISINYFQGKKKLESRLNLFSSPLVHN